jgi:GH15 family glucan-1,4-alpha-glucosidase
MKNRYEEIKDYALIGNGRSAALISKNGSIDWLAWPRFDSPSLFAAILDCQKGGYWSIMPCCPFEVKREYVKNTMVLKTTFICETGSAELIDCMPIGGENIRYLTPEQYLIRIIRGQKGTVPFQMEIYPSPQFGKTSVKRFRNFCGVHYDWNGRTVLLRSDCEMNTDGPTTFTAHPDSIVSMELSFVKDSPAVLHPCGPFLLTIVDDTITMWQRWSRKCTYKGSYENEVIRSALVLKSLIYSPSGAIIAAPTTSLPEIMNGDYNWDYRYCWLRDASLTVRALLHIGFEEEAKAFASWLLHTTRLSRPKLRVFYDVYGGFHEKEENIDWFSGYNNSRPVRSGNKAAKQYQLDIYGEVIDAVGHIVTFQNGIDHETEQMLLEFGKFICEHWDEPDQGIWEPREDPSQHVHSKISCWTGLNRLTMLQEKKLLRNKFFDLFKNTMQQIRSTVEKNGWSDKEKSYIQKYTTSALDMSLLHISWHSFEPICSNRMKDTYNALHRKLYAGNGLFYRNEQSKILGEGAFGICSFWAVEYLARGGGNVADATHLFETMLSLANDLELYSEEIEPKTLAFLGNFPQAFTHIGLINAAMSIEERKLQEKDVCTF